MEVKIKEEQHNTVSFQHFYDNTGFGPHVFQYKDSRFMYTDAQRYGGRLCVNLTSGFLVVFRGDELVVPLKGYFECELDAAMLEGAGKSGTGGTGAIITHTRTLSL